VNPFQNGDVEAWDQHHGIVGMEELSHTIISSEVSVIA
jgi:hypothetical protein